LKLIKGYGRFAGSYSGYGSGGGGCGSTGIITLNKIIIMFRMFF
jgi:hypothetical protein